MKLGLTSTRVEARKSRIGGSAARVLMSGDGAAVLQLYEEMRGTREPPDMSDVLDAQMGLWTEELNRLWFARHTGREVTDAGLSVDHPVHWFLSCTLDGITTVESERAIFEAKHLNPFRFDEQEAIAKFQPQLQHYMMVNSVAWSVLSMFVGTSQWRFAEVPADPFYQAQLLERELEFYRCVEAGIPPSTGDAIVPPSPFTRHVVVDMTGSNEWAACADDYLRTCAAVKINDEASKALRKMVATDVGEAHGHGVQVKRDKSGRLRLSTKGE